jgi:hypothetical protein
MRNGDFSDLRTASGTLIRIYDPFQTDPQTFSRPQFNYQNTPNRIDPSRISPLAKYIYNTLPLPNLPGVNPLVSNNYFGPRPDSTHRRMDYQLPVRSPNQRKGSDVRASDPLRFGPAPSFQIAGDHRWRRQLAP